MSKNDRTRRISGRTNDDRDEWQKINTEQIQIVLWTMIDRVPHTWLLVYHFWSLRLIPYGPFLFPVLFCNLFPIVLASAISSIIIIYYTKTQVIAFGRPCVKVSREKVKLYFSATAVIGYALVMNRSRRHIWTLSSEYGTIFYFRIRTVYRLKLLSIHCFLNFIRLNVFQTLDLNLNKLLLVFFFIFIIIIYRDCVIIFVLRYVYMFMKIKLYVLSRAFTLIHKQQFVRKSFE